MRRAAPLNIDKLQIAFLFYNCLDILKRQQIIGCFQQCGVRVGAGAVSQHSRVAVAFPLRNKCFKGGVQLLPVGERQTEKRSKIPGLASEAKRGRHAQRACHFHPCTCKNVGAGKRIRRRYLDYKVSAAAHSRLSTGVLVAKGNVAALDKVSAHKAYGCIRARFFTRAVKQVFVPVMKRIKFADNGVYHILSPFALESLQKILYNYRQYYFKAII